MDAAGSATGGRKRILDGGVTDNGLLGSDGGEGERNFSEMQAQLI